MSIEIYNQLLINIKVSCALFILLLIIMLANRLSGITISSQFSFILKNHKARVIALLSMPLWVGGLISAGLYGVPDKPSELYKLYDLLIGLIFLIL